jgi:hypothetical protein
MIQKKEWDTPEERISIGGDCYKLNKNNDCRFFKKKTIISSIVGFFRI